MTPRDYQIIAIRETADTYTNSPILVSPTGSGKTFMGTRAVKQLVEQTQQRVLWLAHRRELISQARTAFERAGIATGAIMAGEPYTDAPVQVGSIETFRRRLSSCEWVRDITPEFACMVLDECHHAAAKTIEGLCKVIGVPIIGLTATPFRLDGKGLGRVFGQINVAAYADQLIEQGYLINPRVYAHPNSDRITEGVKLRGKDFDSSATAERMSKRAIVGDIVTTWLEKGQNLPTLGFAVNIEHSQLLVSEFRAAGVIAEHIDGTTPNGQREATLYRLGAGSTKIVFNVGLVGEGFDLPQCAILIDAQPTNSLALHIQKVGRIMRKPDGKDVAIVLDHAGNHNQHGFATQRLEYSLQDGVVVTPEARPSEKRCEDCYLILVGNTCPQCGQAATVIPRPMPEAKAGKLVEFAPLPEMPFAAQKAIWDELVEQRRLWRKPEWWLIDTFKKRTGVSKVCNYGEELIDPRNATQEQQRKVYGKLVAIANRKGRKVNWAGHIFKSIFGHWPSYGVAS